MTEVMLPETDAPCPVWCVFDKETPDHEHVSADVTAGSAEQPLSARLVQVEDDAGPRVQLNGRVADLEEFGAFVSCLQRLVDQAQLAPAGCELVDDLIKETGVTLSDVAQAAGLEVSWVRAQHAGRQLLSVHQHDRLVLTAAGLAAASVAG